MRNIVIVSSKTVNRVMLQQFVTEKGGYWNEDITLDQGVIEDGDKVVYLSCSSDMNAEFDAEELKKLSARLGDFPKTIIDIHISNTENSDKLASVIADEIINKWNSVITE